MELQTYISKYLYIYIFINVYTYYIDMYVHLYISIYTKKYIYIYVYTGFSILPRLENIRSIELLLLALPVLQQHVWQKQRHPVNGRMVGKGGHQNLLQ